MTQVIFFSIIIILFFDFFLERTLSVLNIRAASKALPDMLMGIYDVEKYKSQQKYFKVNTRFGLITSSFTFLVTLFMIVFGGFNFVNQLAESWLIHPVLTPVIFFGILFFANDIIGIPFEWYDTFVIEQRFGFNKVTRLLFITDKLKSYAMTTVLGGLLLSAIVWIYSISPDYFWLFSWLVITGFSLFMTMFYSEIIVPLFNKQKPLPEGELRTAIESFALRSDFRLKNIYVIDGSKRSTKANAYFTGFGPKKRIVLYDTLMDKLSIDEIVAVLAHEVGHYKNNHTVKNLLVSLPTTLLLFYLLGLILKSDDLAIALGGKNASFQLNAIAFSILYTPVSLVLDLFGNVLSRKYEFQADAFAAGFGKGESLVSALKKLSATSLSNLMPHPLYVFFHYSHPTLYQRIMKLQINSRSK